MTIDEIKSAITFIDSESPVFQHHRVLTAKFRVLASVNYSKQPSTFDQYKIVEMAKDNLRETIVRKLYEDQRRSLYEAIRELYMVEPFNFTAQREILDKIIKVAQFQKPEFKLDETIS